MSEVERLQAEVERLKAESRMKLADAGLLIYTERQAREAAEKRATAAEAEAQRLRLNLRDIRCVDATPNEGLVERILTAYIDEGVSTDNTAGLTPTNWVCVAMNDAQAKRNEILRRALAVFATVAAERKQPEQANV